MIYNNWKLVKLEEIFCFYNGKVRPKTIGRVPVFGGNGILDYTDEFNYNGENIIIGRVGAYCGNVHYYSGKIWVSDNAIDIKPVSNVTFGKFSFYLLKNLNLSSMKIGSSQPLITQSILKSIIVKVPSYDEQVRIANILSSIDDKIVLNNQINKNLEEIGNTLFKKWFVEFEFPNEDGETYKSNGGEMIDSGLGLIPKGWQFSNISNFISNKREKLGSRKYPVLSAVNIGKLVLSTDYFNANVPSNNLTKYLTVDKFDFAYNPARINIGSIGMNEFGYSGCVSPVYIVLRPQAEYIFYFNEFFKTNAFKEEVKLRATGSVRQTLNYSDFGMINVIYPNINVINKFNKIYEKLYYSIKHYQNEIKTLENLRDLLLPKLISGEISVPLKE